RHLFISGLAVIDVETGRRVWQAQGQQRGNGTARIPTRRGLLSQVNSKDASRLTDLPIDFERITSTQSSWPSDALLAPGMPASVEVDLSGANLQELEPVLQTALQNKLEK